MTTDRQDDFTRTRRNRLSKLDRQLRDADIWELRAKGYSVLQIAEHSGYSPAQVRSSLSHVAEEYKVESAAEIIKMELDRLDIMLVHAMEALERTYIAYSNGRKMTDTDENGNEVPVEDVAPVMKAIDMILKIMDRRSKYLGLDAPTKSESSINVHQDPSQVDLQVLNLINQFADSARAISPTDLAALPQTPQHETITLPADHFTTVTEVPAHDVHDAHS